MSMELRYSPTSPYVRKVLATAIELGLDGQIELVTTSPYDPDSDLRSFNPLSKVPCLRADGLVLFDSPVICEYLDSCSDLSVFPDAGPARWECLRQQAQADGILDASLLRRYELDREEAMRSATWDARQRLAVTTALDAFDAECVSWNTDVTIGRIAVGCALGYLDLRYADEIWRDGRLSLAAWFDFFSGRDSMQRTAPQA